MGIKELLLLSTHTISYTFSKRESLTGTFFFAEVLKVA
jgi:hypothetical protein